MRVSTLLSSAFVSLALASPLVERDVATKTDAGSSSITAGLATPLVTENRMIARAAVPTCNPTNVAIVKSQKPSSSLFCDNWWAAKTHSAPITVTGLTNAQISNICNCIFASTWVANPPVKTSSTIKTSSNTIQSSGLALATTYQQRVIVHHNVHRANHSASDLTWSQSLANTAAKIGASCVYAHNVTADGGGYGQNIAAGAPAGNISAVITELFYNGEVGYYKGLYGQENPDLTNFEHWGHFSQVVWKGTTQVGCATVDCSAKGLANVGQYVAPYFTVCNYGPPGNYLGEFGDNVGSPLGRPTVHWDYDLY